MSDNPWQRMEDDYNRRCAEMRKGMDFTEQVRAIEQVREAQFRKIMNLDAPKPKRWQFRQLIKRLTKRKQRSIILTKRNLQNDDNGVSILQGNHER